MSSGARNRASDVARSWHTSARDQRAQRGPAKRGRSHAAVLTLQRTAGNRAVTQLLRTREGWQRVKPSTRGGAPLDGATRKSMESRFGPELGAVRVHTGLEAQHAAAALGAEAFTSGTHIWFGERAGPEDGRLLAHELAHVVQQVQGRASALTGTGGDPSTRESLEREASRAGAAPVADTEVHPAPAEAARTPVASEANATGVVQLSPDAGATQGVVLKYEDGTERRLQKGDAEFAQKYVDNHIVDFRMVADDTERANMLEAKEDMYSTVLVVYSDGRSAELPVADIPIAYRQAGGPGVGHAPGSA